jgi:hypothetical protein
MKKNIFRGGLLFLVLAGLFLMQNWEIKLLSGNEAGYQSTQKGFLKSDEKNEVPIKNEDYFNSLLAEHLGGISEVRHQYQFSEGQAFIKIDIETEIVVIEGGLDKRSSLDSVQQALFAASLTGKKPAIVIYDTDGIEGRYEFRIRKASERAGVAFFNPKENDLKSASFLMMINSINAKNK